MQQQAIVPNTATLFKYTLFSIIFAVITLVTIILPAEYNIDPTGVGHVLGLTVFNNEEAKVEAKGAVEHIDIIVPAQSGVEYKFTMLQHQKLTYRWVTDGAALYFDLHGEPKDNTTGYFESYAIATLNGMEGSFTTPFQGTHGWYWKNTSNTPVVIQLTIKGEYTNHNLK
jgi:prepilin signal peptidase PulO-like enzyme (type II secretory pathway)